MSGDLENPLQYLQYTLTLYLVMHLNLEKLKFDSLTPRFKVSNHIFYMSPNITLMSVFVPKYSQHLHICKCINYYEYRHSKCTQRKTDIHRLF